MMVLAILLEMTSPTRSLRWARPGAGGVVVAGAVGAAASEGLEIVSAIVKKSCRSLGSCGFPAELGDAGFDASDVAAQGAQAGGLLELGAGLLQTQIENLLPQVAAIG